MDKRRLVMVDKQSILDSLDIKAYYSSELPSIKWNSSDRGQALCPFHDDHKASLSVNQATGQFKCFGCNKKGSVFDFYMARHNVDYRTALNALAKEAGLITEPQRKIIKTYNYRNESGNLLFQTVRYEPKDFRQRRPDGKGGWIWNLEGVHLVPYNLPEISKSKSILIVEGEKDVETLQGLGTIASTNAMGAGKWKPEYNQHFKDKNVAIIPDNDKVGRDHALQVAKNLKGIAESVKVIELPDLLEKEDVSDWIARGHTKKELIEIIKQAPEWEESKEELKHHFNLIRASELLSNEELQTEWLWYEVLPDGGLSLVVSKPKVGKTTFSINLAIAVSKGDDFLGKKTTKGPVVYLALEEKKEEVQKLLSSFSIANEDIYFHFGPAPVEAIKEIQPLIEQTHCRLLVIDILQKFVRARDINDYAQVTALLEPLMIVARQEGCHILMTHHAGKRDRPGGDDILGSTGLLGGVDTSIHLKKRDGKRVLFTIQRYGKDIPETVIALNDGKLEAIGSREEVEIEETIPLILDALGGDPLTEKEIWNRVEKGHTIISKGLRKLVENQKVKRSGSGKRGDPYNYSLLLSSIYIGESRRETLTAPKPAPDKAVFSSDDFGKNQVSGERIGEGILTIKGNIKL